MCIRDRLYEISWTLFPDTVLLTVIFFVVSFFVVGVFNTRTIKKTKIIDMLSAEKENEPELKKSRFISVVVVLFEVFTAVSYTHLGYACPCLVLNCKR